MKLEKTYDLSYFYFLIIYKKVNKFFLYAFFYKNKIILIIFIMSNQYICHIN